MNKGVGYFKAKEYDRAAIEFKRAIRMDPTYAEAFLDLGLTYMEVYEPGSTHPKDIQYADAAIESFKRYIRLKPEDLKARDYLINMCSTAGRVDVAIEFFMEYYEKEPDSLQLVQMLAALHHRKGDTASAIEWSDKAAVLQPDNPEAFYSVGVACWGHSYNSPFLEYEDRMAILDKGLEAIAKARELRDEYFEALTYESLIYREKVKYDISPAQSVVWRQKADELLAQALEIRNARMAAQAAEMDRKGGEDSPDAQAAASHGE
jgi:predicted Zn-dependent protease